MKNELIETLIKLFERDLNKLSLELSQYRDERSIWLVRGEIKNTAGNLCLHLCGNLQHYIGVGLAKTDYKRDRDREFADKDISRDELLRLVARTKETVLNALLGMEANGIIIRRLAHPYFTPGSGKVSFCFVDPLTRERLHRGLSPFQ